jgi:hypothetical protein
MAAHVLRYISSWRDAKGFVARVAVHVHGEDADATFLADVSTVANNLRTAIAGLSNAAFAGDTGLSTANTPTLTYGTNAEYPTEWQKAVMQFSNDSAQIGRFKIPAPKIAIMDTDGVTVLNDGSVAVVVAYVNAMKNATNNAFICNAAGLPWTHFEGGLVRFGRQPKRINERIKSSHLVQGEGE